MNKANYIRLILVSTLLAGNVTQTPAQAPLTPPGPPSPTQKSLQEIWDKIDGLENQVETLEDENAELLAGVAASNALASYTHYANGGSFPWVLTELATNLFLPDDTSLAFGPDGQPAIAYQTNGAGGGLKFARLSQDAGWVLTDIDTSDTNAGLGASLAFRPDGFPMVSYYHPGEDELRVAGFDGTQWIATEVTSVDYNAIDIGAVTSLNFLPGGQVYVVASKEGSLELGSWQERTGTNPLFFDYNGGITDEVVGSSVSMTITPDGIPAVVYLRDEAGGIDNNLKFATFNGSTWSSGNILTATGVGSYTSLAYGPNEQPGVAYYDGVNQQLGFLTPVGPFGIWSNQIVDASAFIDGPYCSLAYGPDGLPAIAYGSTDGLKFARYNGSAWIVTKIDRSVGSDTFTSLAFGPDGLPAISYMDTAGEILKFARMAFPQP